MASLYTQTNTQIITNGPHLQEDRSKQKEHVAVVFVYFVDFTRWWSSSFTQDSLQ